MAQDSPPAPHLRHPDLDNGSEFRLLPVDGVHHGGAEGDCQEGRGGRGDAALHRQAVRRDGGDRRGASADDPGGDRVDHRRGASADDPGGDRARADRRQPAWSRLYFANISEIPRVLLLAIWSSAPAQPTRFCLVGLPYKKVIIISIIIIIIVIININYDMFTLGPPLPMAPKGRAFPLYFKGFRREWSLRMYCNRQLALSNNYYQLSLSSLLLSSLLTLSLSILLIQTSGPILYIRMNQKQCQWHQTDCIGKRCEGRWEGSMANYYL